MFGHKHEDGAKLRAVDKDNPWVKTETFIDQGCELIGELRFEGAVRIDGRVEGTIHAAQGVTIGKTAEIAATVHAQSIEIHGRVDGDLHVAHATTLHESARVDGEIQTAGIVVEEGAMFSGTIRIAPTIEPMAAATATSDANDANDANKAKVEDPAATAEEQAA